MISLIIIVVICSAFLVVFLSKKNQQETPVISEAETIDSSVPLENELEDLSKGDDDYYSTEEDDNTFSTTEEMSADYMENDIDENSLPIDYFD